MPIRGVLKMIAIPNMEKPKECWECPCVNDSDCQALDFLKGDSRSYEVPFHGVRPDCPLIDIVECWECECYKGHEEYCEIDHFAREHGFCFYGKRRSE